MQHFALLALIAIASTSTRPTATQAPGRESVPRALAAAIAPTTAATRADARRFALVLDPAGNELHFLDRNEHRRDASTTIVPGVDAATVRGAWLFASPERPEVVDVFVAAEADTAPLRHAVFAPGADRWRRRPTPIPIDGRVLDMAAAPNGTLAAVVCSPGARTLHLAWCPAADGDWVTGSAVVRGEDRIHAASLDFAGTQPLVAITAGDPARAALVRPQLAVDAPMPVEITFATNGAARVAPSRLELATDPLSGDAYVAWLDATSRSRLMLTRIGLVDTRTRRLGRVGPRATFDLGRSATHVYATWRTPFDRLWTAQIDFVDAVQLVADRPSPPDATAVVCPRSAFAARLSTVVSTAAGPADARWTIDVARPRLLDPHHATPSAAQTAHARREQARLAAIDRAVTWLVEHQDQDGSWDADDFALHDIERGAEPSGGAGIATHDVGVTGLALLALQAGGSNLRHGPHKAAVKQAVTWLRAQQDLDTGLLGTNAAQDFIYDHALATWALVDAVARSESRLLRPVAQRALDYLGNHRNPYSVWRYQPRDNDNDSSITGLCVLACTAARDVGLTVDPRTFEMATLWFDEVTEAHSGRCGYTLRGSVSARLRRDGRTDIPRWVRARQPRIDGAPRLPVLMSTGPHAHEFPPEKGEYLSALGLWCRVRLGAEIDDPLLRTIADRVLRRPPTWSRGRGAADALYCWAARHALIENFPRHARGLGDLTGQIVRAQRRDGAASGSWDPIGVWGEAGGRVFTTATLCLALLEGPGPR